MPLYISIAFHWSMYLKFTIWNYFFQHLHETPTSQAPTLVIHDVTSPKKTTNISSLPVITLANSLNTTQTSPTVVLDSNVSIWLLGFYCSSNFEEIRSFQNVYISFQGVYYFELFPQYVVLSVFMDLEFKVIQKTYVSDHFPHINYKLIDYYDFIFITLLNK